MNFFDQTFKQTINTAYEKFLICQKCTFIDCSSDFKGGAITTNVWTINVSIFGSSFIRCSGKEAGALWLKAKATNISTSCFSNCYSPDKGFLYSKSNDKIDTSDIIIDDCSLMGVKGYKILTIWNDNTEIKRYNASLLSTKRRNENSLTLDIDLSENGILKHVIQYDVGISQIDSKKLLIDSSCIFGDSMDFKVDDLQCVNSQFEMTEIRLKFTDNYTFNNCKINSIVVFHNETHHYTDNMYYPDIRENSCSVEGLSKEKKQGNFTERLTYDLVYSVVVDNSVFFKCQSESYGGGIFLDFNLMDFNISSTLFYECKACQGGAMHIFIRRSELFTKICTINCRAAEISSITMAQKYNNFSKFDQGTICCSSDNKDRSNIIIHGYFEKIDFINITNGKVCDNILSIENTVDHTYVCKCTSDTYIASLNDDLLNSFFINNTVNIDGTWDIFLDMLSFEQLIVNTVFWNNKNFLYLDLWGTKCINCSIDVVPECMDNSSFTIITTLKINHTSNNYCATPFKIINYSNNEWKKIAIGCSIAMVIITIISLIVYILVLKHRSDDEKKQNLIAKNIIVDFG